jgi:protein O-GlcNAc transferase
MANQNDLFQTAYRYHRDGQYSQAESAYRQLIAQQPRYAEALHLLGVLCHQTSRHEEAANLIARAIAIDPNNADYLNNCGLALRAAGRNEDALSCYEEALRLSPKDAGIQNNLGNIYQELGRFEEAAASYRRVLRAYPQDADLRQALVSALVSQGDLGFGNGHFAQAEACYQEALGLAPAMAAMHYNLANAKRELGKPAEAAALYRRYIELVPDDADAWNNLGNVLRELGRLDEAVAAYRKALEIDPGLHHAKVHLVHQQQHMCDWDGLSENVSEIRRWVQEAPEALISPFAFLAMPGTTAAEQRRCAMQWAKHRHQSLIELGRNLAFNYVKTPGRRLRVGYLSGDFRLHPLAFLITEMIELHDGERFEISAYSYARDDKTRERKRLEEAFDHFVDITAMSMPEAAKKIHADQIDILVDLTGFTQNSRSGILAMRPAPIQVNWLGFPGTMGAPYIDYLISDAFITPGPSAPDYSEKLVLLPHSYQPNDRSRPIGKSPIRADYGLPEGAFVFCCFNQTFKITPDIFDTWMRLLKAVPGSVLWLLECNSWAKKNLIDAAEARGIHSERLIFAPRVPIADHLARHDLADLCLDTIPYNAHTTASDALWMCLPIVTIAGDTFASRVAASLLRAANLPELVTASLEDYETLALTLADDPGMLENYRERLLHSSSEIPLFNTAAFTTDLEKAYLQMYENYLAGAPPKSFSVN